jgi:hypothetical protein
MQNDNYILDPDLIFQSNADPTPDQTVKIGEVKKIGNVLRSAN